MSYEKKLLEMKGLLKKNTPEKQQPKKEVLDIALPFYTEQWEKAGLKLIKNEKGFFFLKETFYRNKHIHGTIGLDKLEAAISFMQERYPTHPLTISPNSPYCFYDTETTGLKGAGVLIFLNGILKKAPGGYLLSQYVLADPGQEAAFLLATEFWKNTQTIITYNGKSFDLPQLTTRWTMNRNTLPPMKSQGQIDLMHSSKRIWKGDLERFKLKQLEESKLGFSRKNDIPGHLAPIIYFDAVKHGNPTNLMRILKHNEWDILSLATLYTLSVDLLKETEVQETANTYTNIGKWFKDLKSKDASKEWFQFVLDQFPERETSMAYYYMGLHLKRQKLMDESIEAFKEALKEIKGKYRLEVLVELAKLYEHQKKDYEKALEMTLECLEYWRDSEIDSHKDFSSQLRRREIRINKKINISRESAQPNKKRT